MKIKSFLIDTLTTRKKIIVSVVILTVIYIVVLLLEQLEDIQISGYSFRNIRPVPIIILTVLGYIMMFWISAFRIKGERFITILGFPSIGIFVFSLFSKLVISSIFGQLGDLLFIIITGVLFAFFIYILFITANILNASYLDNIPLGQAGRAAYYVFNLVIAYLLFTIIVSNEVFIGIQLLLIYLVTFYIVLSSLWTIKLSVTHRFLVASAISFLLVFVYIGLAIWPIDVSLITFILSAILYMSLGVALEVREVINRMVWVEYGVLFLLIFLILIIVSEWGINGTLI